MKNFDTRAYSISDFIEWYDNGLLELSPDFQRRAVWSEKAKSYLIDTIVQGKPIPKIIITQKLQGKRNIRIVVDGQQRLRAILEYYSDSFKISKAHNEHLSKCVFSTLPHKVADDFIKYELGVDLLFDTTYENLLEIFARINSYTVTLNKQEKFNANYLGYFKQYAFRYGYKYVKYFLDGGILTKARVARMAEAELASDLFVAIVGGVQTNKNVENYYRKYDDKPGTLPKASTKFDRIMSFIGAIYPPSEIVNTNWSRIHLFYTLFTSIGHLLYKLNGLDLKIRTKINKKDINKLRFALDEISLTYDNVAADLDNPKKPKDYKAFITQSRRGTTDTSTRINRSNFLCKKIKEYLK